MSPADVALVPDAFEADAGEALPVAPADVTLYAHVCRLLTLVVAEAPWAFLAGMWEDCVATCVNVANTCRSPNLLWRLLTALLGRVGSEVAYLAVMAAST